MVDWVKWTMDGIGKTIVYFTVTTEWSMLSRLLSFANRRLLKLSSTITDEEKCAFILVFNIHFSEFSSADTYSAVESSRILMEPRAEKICEHCHIKISK